MTNSEYITKTIHANDCIYIDTATLMECDAMHQFVNSNRDTLLSAGRRITIPCSVYAELARHLSSENLRKREKALEAINLISENRNLFEVHCVTLTDDEIAKAFADVHILSDLTLNKPIHNQLLITNDRNLSSDAYKLNQQESCKGHRIMVCHINQAGELHKCSCVGNQPLKKTVESIPSITAHPLTEVVQSEPLVAAPESADTLSKWTFDLKSGVVSIMGVGILYCLAKGGKNLSHYIKL